MKILYVPHWLAAAVRAQSAPKSVYTDVKALLNIASTEDVAFYMYLNNRLTQLLPEGITSTFDSCGSAMLDQIFGHDEFSPLMRFWDDYDMQNRARPDNTEGRLLTCDLGDEHTLVFTHATPTDAVMRQVGADPLLWLYDRAIRIYSAFIAPEGLAATPLFLQYQRALSANIHPTA